MVNREKLKAAIAASGVKRVAIAKRLGISLHALANKINGLSEFKLSEMLAIEDMLRLSTDETRAIFFEPCVESDSTAEALRG